MKIPASAGCAAWMIVVLNCSALDIGTFQHPLTLDLTLPAPAEAISPDRVLAVVTRHLRDVMATTNNTGPAREYWSDYRAVLSSAGAPVRPLPVLVALKDGRQVVARYLVGLACSNTVKGFFAVDASREVLLSPLMWNRDLQPLWSVSAEEWNNARSVNEIPALAELVPPYAQFTLGIPIDPNEAQTQGFTFVESALDLPAKAQEERREWIEGFNARHGTQLKKPLGTARGRRTGTMKCMSVAASYMADWWLTTTGNELPTYVNGVGGQKEYGVNPRLLETLFIARHRQMRFLKKWFGDFKRAIIKRDDVTGESIMYSPRGYSRLLVETPAGTWTDPLLASVVYDLTNNPFGMDQKPLSLQIFRRGIFPRTQVRADLRHAKDPEYPFQVAPDHKKKMTPERLMQALDTWGPLLLQHMSRDMGGNPLKGWLGNAAHACLLVGYGRHGGQPVFVYRETFGEAGARYLEDNFLGPTYRLMPMSYLYQAIAFPHHLYLDLAPDGTTRGAARFRLKVTTNRGQAPVAPDQLVVRVNGQPEETVKIKKGKKRGEYILSVPDRENDPIHRVEVQARKQYFADYTGNGLFTTALERKDGAWGPDQK